MEVKEKLVFLRKQHGMTQVELAERLGISRQTVSKWECGTVFPSSENLVSIGKLFNITTDALLDENYQFQEGAVAAVAETVLVSVEKKPEDAAGGGTGGRQKLKILVYAACAVCMLLVTIASIITIHSAVFKEPKNGPIQLDDLIPEYVDPSEVNDGTDGWTIIKE